MAECSKTMACRLSILIATQGRRNEKFLALLESLERQIEVLPIEVLAFWNNGELSIGEIRQRLVEAATGDYTCFIDDDDKIPAYYCQEILTHLGKDYVGFEVQLFEKDVVMPRVFHSIKYGIWHQDENGYYRSITHLNPLKREIALQGKFGVNGIGEDEDWARSIQPLVRTENYIDKIMYYYLHDMDDTSFGGPSIDRNKKYERPKVNYPWFRYIDE